MGDTDRQITVHIKLFRQAFPEKDAVQLPQGACVADLMALLEPKYFRAESKLSSQLPLKEMSTDDLLLILNGRLINNLRGRETQLKDGDVFAVFPVMSGG